MSRLRVSRHAGIIVSEVGHFGYVSLFADRVRLIFNGGFSRSGPRLRFLQVFESGHLVPKDQPEVGPWVCSRKTGS